MSTSSTTPAALVARSAETLLITINRPEAMNAVNAEVSVAIGEALAEAERDPGIRAVVLTGAGERAFCAGADLKAVARGEELDDLARPEWGFAGYVQHVISKPTIAAVNGFAFGGGMELVLASDLVVALETAQFGQPEVKHGTYAGAGGVIRLPRQIPRKIAMEMILTGDPISAAEAQRWGLVNRVVEHDVVAAALELAGRITANAPLSIQASKRGAYGIVDGTIPADEAAWALCEEEQERLNASEDSIEGARAFAEKRAPIWKGR